MSLDPRIILRNSICGLLLCAPTLADEYGPQTFAVPDGTTNLGDGTTIAGNDGVASIQNGALQLTRAGTGDTSSSFRISPLGNSSQGWTATFEFLLADNPGGSNPADGFSFNYGSIPTYNPSQSEESAPDAHGGGEEGWHPSVAHISFEVDSWDNGGGEDGLNIAISGEDIAFENQTVLSNGQSISGSMEISWSPATGASMKIDLGAGLLPIFTNVDTPQFSGNDSYGFAFSARTGGAHQSFSVDNLRITTSEATLILLPEPVISEFMADNEETIEDEDCRTSDWIELFNSTAEPRNLAGWHLTDNPSDLTKWRVPDLPLGPNQRRIVFASGKDRPEGELHTNFSINKNGGFLALVKPDGITVTSSYNFGQQYGDVSYGRLGEAQSEGYFGNPSPGGINVAPQGIPVSERPEFSHDDQIITRSINLALSTPSPTATIRYTTDGSDPTSGSSLYLTPIRITATTRVKARIFEPGREPGPVRDRTYLRLASDIRNFSSDLPLVIIDSFGANIDGESSANSQNPRRPVQSIFVDVDATSGRATVTDVPDFAGRGGMRVRGQTSAGFAKKQYSFETWDSDGNDKNVSIWGWPSESDWIIHAPYSDKTLMRNKIVYDCSRELGYPSVRTKFCELFFNSNGGNISMADYRGVYVFMEKIKRDEDRVNIKALENCDTGASSISGGYIIKKDKGQTVDVTLTTAREGHQLAFVEPDLPGSAQQAWLKNYMDSFENALHGPEFTDPLRGYANYIDVDSFIDTHIWVEVFKNIDGYRLSSYFYKDRGRKLVASPVWDYNLSLGNADYLEGEYPQGWYYSLTNAQQYPWYGRLFQDPEFVTRYWDRWFELRKGMLATARMMTLIDSYTANISEAAARNFEKWDVLGSTLWPNARVWTPPSPLPGSDRNLSGAGRRNSHQDEVDWMKGWLWARLDWIDNQYTSPPSFSRQGGPATPGTSLTMTNNTGRSGTIYYTTDGSDPRRAGNASSTTLLRAGSPLRWFIPTGPVNGWNSVNGPGNLAAWESGNAGLGYENSPDDYDGLIETTVPGGTTSVYTRFEFNIGSQAILDGFDNLSLNIRYDDGFVAYLNGVRVAGPNAPVNPAWNSDATGSNPDSAAVNFEAFDISNSLDQLRVGNNVLAIQLLNTGTTSSDLLLDPQLVGGNSGSLISPSAQPYSSRLTLNESQTVSARILAPGGWGALQTESFLINGQMGSVENIVISELNYRPGAPTPEEESAGFDARTDFEFIEIMNIGPAPIDLEGIAFTSGIEFDFDLGDVQFLVPGERAVVVSNRDAFQLRYGDRLSGIRIAGEFSNNLSNDGETIILSSASGSDIRNFTYNDVSPWPEAADGDGLSLVLRSPSSAPDHDYPPNWRSSTTPNGIPGSSDPDLLAGSPLNDDDENGISNLVQHAFSVPGGPMIQPSATIERFVNGDDAADYMTFTYTRNPAADDIMFTVQISPDLQNWISEGNGDILPVRRIENEDGTETLTYRYAEPAAGYEQLFGRVLIQHLP